MTTSKKNLIAVVLMLLITPVLAQTKNAASAKATPTKDCFREWLDLFRDRGGKPVPDGAQECIITLRRQEKTVCFMGKIDVAGGKVKPPLWVQKEDGSYETFAAMGKKLDPEFTANLSEDDIFAITDGMSISFRTSEQEYGRLFFYKFLNDKPKANKVAPSPSALIKN